MDATMKRSRMASLVASVFSLALVPFMWAFAFDGLPSLQTVRAETSGGRMGPLLFAWTLVWIATLCCVGVAWVCYSSLDDEAH